MWPGEEVLELTRYGSLEPGRVQSQELFLKVVHPDSWYACKIDNMHTEMTEREYVVFCVYVCVGGV